MNKAAHENAKALREPRVTLTPQQAADIDGMEVDGDRVEPVQMEDGTWTIAKRVLDRYPEVHLKVAERVAGGLVVADEPATVWEVKTFAEGEEALRPAEVLAKR